LARYGKVHGFLTFICICFHPSEERKEQQLSITSDSMTAVQRIPFIHCLPGHFLWVRAKKNRERGLLRTGDRSEK
jgi:hypothetical protein